MSLEKFGPGLWVAEGPAVSFYGFPYPTRMAVAKLVDGSAWIWSPIALTAALAAAVEAVGPVRFVVSPNKIHHLFLSDWAERWPDARLYAPPGLAAKRQDLRFHGELEDAPPADWSADIYQVVFRGSLWMEEVVFFHRESHTVIFGDLIQRFPETDMTGWRGAVMRLDGLVGAHGSTPREWRASFLKRAGARAARDRVLGWQPERLLIAHGECAQAGAAEIIRGALGWM